MSTVSVVLPAPPFWVEKATYSGLSFCLSIVFLVLWMIHILIHLFVGFFRLMFQPYSRRPSVVTAYSPCRDTAGETDNQVSVATNQWPLGHESLSTDQPADCLTSFGLSVQINNKMSVLVSFFSHVAACGVVVAAFGVVPAGFRVDILPNFAPGRRGLSVGVLPDGF